MKKHFILLSGCCVLFSACEMEKSHAPKNAPKEMMEKEGMKAPAPAPAQKDDNAMKK